ncbi:MAG: DNA-processing protein DprA [Candidatus Aminicenantes bacterium]|nr:MAG: DNA-processing protein DprA [Candidatus Aminicenantes bacterium]
MIELEYHHLERIAFNLVTSINQKARRRLLKKNIGAKSLPGCSTTELNILGFSDNEINDIKTNYIKVAEEEAKKTRENNVDIIFKEDEYYPAALSEIYDPPDYIYVQGNKEILKTDKIAVVGSRRGSSYGWHALNKILPDLCKVGLTIVSGMAYGIDSMAHKIALKENGSTIGVNAGGLLNLYPSGNKGLIHQIIEKGCVISEFALDTIPRPFYFPIRNRIIAGISKGILVAEAAFKSGSLITARLGLDQNRDIFSIPGRIDSPISQGTNYLIQQGAKLIASSKDILEEYGIDLVEDKKEETFEFSKKEEKILELMADHEVKSIDYFVERLEDLSVSAIISVLMGLILKNVVVEEAGGYRRTGG